MSTVSVPIIPKPEAPVDKASGSADVQQVPQKHVKVILTLDNVLLPQSMLDLTPSFKDGLDVDVENDLRFLGCELIQSGGILLKLPQVAMATGQVIFQRFFYSKSFVRNNMEIAAIACLNLATKIEESPRRLRDIINVFHHLRQVRFGKTIAPMLLDQVYVDKKNEVIKAERRVLKELGFSVHVKQPHKMIFIYISYLERENDPKMIQKAWNYMNDSFRTTVFMRYDPEVVACACIFLAGRTLQIALPEEPMSWYELFGCKEFQMRDIAIEVLKLYTRTRPVNWGACEERIDVLYKAYLKTKKKLVGFDNKTKGAEEKPKEQEKKAEKIEEKDVKNEKKEVKDEKKEVKDEKKAEKIEAKTEIKEEVRSEKYKSSKIKKASDSERSGDKLPKQFSDSRSNRDYERSDRYKGKERYERDYKESYKEIRGYKRERSPDERKMKRSKRVSPKARGKEYNRSPAAYSSRREPEKDGQRGKKERPRDSGKRSPIRAPPPKRSPHLYSSSDDSEVDVPHSSSPSPDISKPKRDKHEGNSSPGHSIVSAITIKDKSPDENILRKEAVSTLKSKPVEKIEIAGKPDKQEQIVEKNVEKHKINEKIEKIAVKHVEQTGKSDKNVEKGEKHMEKVEKNVEKVEKNVEKVGKNVEKTVEIATKPEKHVQKLETVEKRVEKTGKNEKINKSEERSKETVVEKRDDRRIERKIERERSDTGSDSDRKKHKSSRRTVVALPNSEQPRLDKHSGKFDLKTRLGERR